MDFAVKTVLAGVIIALASRLSEKNAPLAGFLIALPLSTMLSLTFAYLQHRDMDQVNRFAVSIFVSAPLTLVFFIPFILNRWLKMGFTLSFVFAVGLLCGVYFLQQWVMGLYFNAPKP